MRTGILRGFLLLAGLAAAACTEPVNCTLNASTALTLSLRAPAGTQDVTEGARLEVTQNGIALPQSAIQYPQSGTAATGPIVIFGSGGSYGISVHRATYRDTTVTANVAVGECGPTYPPLALTVTLTAQ